MSKRLQLRNHSDVFETRDEALVYINDIYKSQSLYAEPTIYAYGSAVNPNIILAFGSVGNGSLSAKNRVFTIDSAKIDEDIKNIKEQISSDTSNFDKYIKLIDNIIVGAGLSEDGTYVADVDDELLKKATSVNDAVKKLSSKLHEISKSYSLSVQDTNTVSMTSEKNENGMSIKSDVKISSYGNIDPDYNDNIIVKLNDGLYSTVDLSYDDASGILTFTASCMKDDGTPGARLIKKDFKIGLHTTIKSIVYDKDTETLIITLTDSDGNEYVETVDASEIITEWEVYNKVGNAVRLEKERNKEGIDRLSADVIISDGSTNILTKSVTTGGLYVKGTADNIKYKTDVTVENALDSLQISDENILNESKAYTDSKVNAEEVRATSEETKLRNALNEEILRAKTAEKENSDAIAIINGDNETDGSIKKALKDAKDYTDLETKRAEAVEDELRGQLNIINGNEAVSGSVKEAIKISKNYTDEQVKAEKERAMASEKINSDAIAIINGNEAQEGSIKNAIEIAKDYTDSALEEHDHSAVVQLDELREDLNKEIKRATMYGKETKSLAIAISQGDTGTTISGDVKLSTITGNIISEQDGGLFAYVTLRYSAAENALYFNNGTPTDTKIQLSSSSLIDEAYYDSETKTIVIVFNDEDKTTVKIPVGDLIPTLAVGRESNSSVILRLVTEDNLNTIYADVDVSTDGNNILENINGALLVKGTADNIKYGQDSNVQKEIHALNMACSSNLTEAKAYTDEQVRIEKERAMEAERTERDRAMQVETQLQADLTAEIARATKAENDEYLRATASESALEAKIEKNTSDIKIINGGVETVGSIAYAVNKGYEASKILIDAEKERAMAAENVLSSKIDIINGDGVGSMNDILQKAKDYTDASVSGIPSQIEYAKQEAITTAAADASSKADKAKQEAIAAAAADASTKAENAKNEAIAIAKEDASQKSEAAVNTAKEYTDTQTEKVLLEAKSYTDEQHIYVTGATVNGYTNTITLGFRNSVQTVNIDISQIINLAIENAVNQAVERAKAEIVYTVIPTSSTSGEVNNSTNPREIRIDVTNVNNGTYDVL